MISIQDNRIIFNGNIKKKGAAEAAPNKEERKISPFAGILPDS